MTQGKVSPEKAKIWRDRYREASAIALKRRKRIEKLEAENAELRKVWRDIESAPKDKPILLSKWHEGTLFWAASGELSGEDGKYYISLTDEPLRFSRKAMFNKPTHWTPLLELSEAQRQGGK